MYMSVKKNVQEGNSVDSNWTEGHDSVEPQSRTIRPRNTSMEFMQFQDQNGEDNAERKKNGMKILPFEFVALEACLEAACSELENEVHIYSSSTVVLNFFLVVSFLSLLCRQIYWRRRPILP